MKRDETQIFRHACRTWISPTCCAIAFLTMLALSWQKWADPLVDFGRELYVPWRLAEGEKLYRDIQYFSGPISPCFNSIFIRVFGLKLMTLGWVNISIFALICIGLYRIGTRVSDRISTTIALIGVMVICGFGRLTHRANFNFVTPYSHELTHSLALAVAALVMLDVWLHSRRRAWLCAIGASLGATVLMKPEVFLALAGAIGAGFWIGAGTSPGQDIPPVAEPKTPIANPQMNGASRPLNQRDCLALILPFILVPTSIVLTGGWSSLGALRFIFDRHISDLPFYQKLMGLDEIGANVQSAILYAMTVVGVVSLTWFITRTRRWTTTVAKQLMLAIVFAMVLIGASIALTGSMISANESFWMQLPRAFTILAPITTIIMLIRAFRSQRSSDALLASMGVLATLLLLKMGLNIRFGHYGFALTLPVLFVTGLLIQKANPNPLRWIVLTGFFIAIIVSHLAMTIAYLDLQTMVIQSPIATLRVNPNLEINHDAQRVLTKLSEIAAPDETLGVVPEGVMLNVLSERKNPTGAIVLLPVELFMFGQQDVLARFEKNPPDWLVINLETIGNEFGDNGLAYMPQVREFFSKNYELIEDEPQIGLRIYRRRR